MDTNERDIIIAQLLSEGKSLSDVQKILKDDYQIQLTYMELRMISTELEVNWKKFDDAKSKESKKDRIIDKNKLPADDDEMANDIAGLGNGSSGKTRVTVSKIVRPGSVMSGDVTFKSGASAEWFLDAMGRLGLAPKGNSTAKPTDDDLREFQMELQTVLQGKF
jgi:hypothetical protein